MKNNRGQTLVIFVIFLPIIVIILASVIDIALMYTEKNKVDSINKLVLNYGLDNIKDDNLEQKLENLVILNDDELKISKLNVSQNTVTLNIEKNMRSTFGQLIGIKTYKVVSKYEGRFRNNRKEIIKG